MSLLDMAVQPGDSEAGPDGEPMAVTSTIGEGESAVTTVKGFRWEGGFSWLPRECGNVVGRNECPPAATAAYRTGTNMRREHQPVILSAHNECPTTFGLDWAYEQATAAQLLVAGEPVAAEQELWDGTLARAAIAAGDATYASNLWLTKHGVATVLTGSAVTPKQGLALLEQFLASTGVGAQGMIHIQPLLIPHVGVRILGRQLQTYQGNWIVPGSGYTGNGPGASTSRTVTDATTTSGSVNITSATAAFVAGDVGAAVTGAGIPAGATIATVTDGTHAALSANATATATGVTLTIVGDRPATPSAGTVWAFATGRVTYRRGPIRTETIQPSQAIDRTTNTVTVTAQRSTAGTWDSCAVGAALVTLPD